MTQRLTNPGLIFGTIIAMMLAMPACNRANASDQTEVANVHSEKGVRRLDPAINRNFLGESPIEHRFLGVDESRGQLLYVDQRNPDRSWTLKLPVKSRDYQLIGNHRILLSGNDGYYVYDLDSRTQIKEVHDPRYAGTVSVLRLSNGNTLVACNQNGIAVYQLGPDDLVVKTATFPRLEHMRLMRLSSQGTLLFGAGTKEFRDANLVIEADLSGKVLSQLPLTDAKHVYQAIRLPNGNLFASTGYGHFLAEILPSGAILRRIDAPPSTPGNLYFFFAGFQILKNGNIVVCNWTGHGAKDSAKGSQLVEFDPAGKVVWTWHNAELAGTLHGVLLLDEGDSVDKGGLPGLP